MTFFLDANVLVYAASQNRWRDACIEILEAVVTGAADGKTSVGVLEELWHIELTSPIPGTIGLTERMAISLSPLLAISGAALRRALELGESDAGAFDRLHVGTCLENGIETIVSADRGFDDISAVRRIDPLDSDAVAALLAG